MKRFTARLPRLSAKAPRFQIDAVRRNDELKFLRIESLLNG
jgi:hypothetical protein